MENLELCFHVNLQHEVNKYIINISHVHKQSHESAVHMSDVLMKIHEVSHNVKVKRNSWIRPLTPDP